LVPDQPVVTLATDRGDPIEATGYGPFTGAVPNPEALFAPFTARAAAGASSIGAGSSYPTAIPTNPPPDAGFGSSLPSTPPATRGPPNLSAVGRSLGIEEEPVADANDVRGMRISNVYSGTAAEKAGLHAGDVIYSISGYLTQVRGNLAWIIAHAAPSKVLTMKVRTVSDDKEHTVTAQLP